MTLRTVVNILKYHSAALLLAAIVAGLMYLPQYWFERDLGGEYRGVYLAATDSEEYYAARIGEIYDGHRRAANAYLFEYKQLPYIQPPLPEMLYAGVGKLLGFNRIQAVLFGSRLIFPFLLTLLLYAFVYQLSRSRIVGLLGTALVLLGINLVLDPRAVFDVLGLKTSLKQGLWYSRPVSPQIHSLFLFGYLLLLWEWLKQRRTAFLIGAAIVLGLSFYVYFYLWSFLFAGVGVFALVTVWRRDFSVLRGLLLHLVIALLLAIPYLNNLWQFYQLPDAAFLAHLQGVIPSRAFKFDLLLAAGLIVLLFVGKRLDRTFYQWFASVLFGGFIAINQQVVTGKELHSAHYHWYLVAPLVAVGLVLIAGQWSKRFPLMFYIGAAGFFVFLSFNAFVIQRSTYQYSSGLFRSPQRYAPLFEWLNKTTAKDSVVLTHSVWLNDILPAYTHNNVLTAIQAQLSTTPRERIEFDFYLPVYLEGVEEASAENYFRSHADYTGNLVGGVSTRLRTGGCRTCFADSEYRRISEGYRKFLTTGLDRQLATYQLDYIVDDTINDRWPSGFLGHFTKVAQIGEFVVYRK